MSILPRFTTLPHRQAWHLAWPMILSNISVPLMGLADTAMLGHLDSPLYLGAVAIGANLLALFYWMFAFLRMSSTALTGQAYGAGNETGISLQLLQGGLFALLPALVLILSSSLLLPVGLAVMAEDVELRQLAMEYCQIRIFSAPAVFLTYVLIGWFIGLQNTRWPLFITVISNLINLFLDYLFIVEFGWAHKGAAQATLIAEYSALLIGLSCIFYRYRNYITLLTKIPALTRSIKLTAVLTLNANLFVRTLVLLLVFNFLIMQSANQGATILAVNAILMQLMLFVAFALDGYAHAAETMVAHAIGARNAALFFRSSVATTLPALVIAAGLSLTFYLFSNGFIALMSDQDSIRSQASLYFYWLYLLPLVSVGCYMLDGIFIGAGQTRLMLVMMLISVVAVFFPCWWLFRSFENHGLWAAFTLFNFSRTTLMTMAYYSLSTKMQWIQK